MDSKEVEIVLKYFREPHHLHEEVWVMCPRFNPFDTIIASTYSGCWEKAQEQINDHFKYVKP